MRRHLVILLSLAVAVSGLGLLGARIHSSRGIGRLAAEAPKTLKP
jgi:hypothetical protein